MGRSFRFAGRAGLQISDRAQFPGRSSVHSTLKCPRVKKEALHESFLGEKSTKYMARKGTSYVFASVCVSLANVQKLVRSGPRKDRAELCISRAIGPLLFRADLLLLITPAMQTIDDSSSMQPFPVFIIFVFLSSRLRSFHVSVVPHGLS